MNNDSNTAVCHSFFGDMFNIMSQVVLFKLRSIYIGGQKLVWRV